MAGGAAVAEISVHRTVVWLVSSVLWCVVVVAGLVRGWLVVPSYRPWLGLGAMVAVVGTTVAVRALWRHPHRLVWTAEGSLVLRSLAGGRVVSLEPPVEVRVCESTLPSGEYGERDVTDLVIASHGESVAVASAGRRANATRRLAAVVAEGTGAEPPEREVLTVSERRKLRGDPALRWLNAGGDFTPGQFWGLLAALFVAAPLTVLAGVAVVAMP